jgi:hypothetical protein
MKHFDLRDDLASNRNEYQESSWEIKGQLVGKADNLTSVTQTSKRHGSLDNPQFYSFTGIALLPFLALTAVHH